MLNRLRNPNSRRAAVAICLAMSSLCVDAAFGGVIWLHRVPDDAALSLARIAGSTGAGRPALAVGLASGRVVCLSTAPSPRPEILWTCDLGAPVLALLAIPDANGDGAGELVAATGTGLVACLTTGGTAPGKRLWAFNSTCNVTALSLVGDINGDGHPEIAVGGADHRVHLCDGRTGARAWSHLLASRGGGAYVTRLAGGADIDRDGVPDVVAWTWSGALCALNGRNGDEIWTAQVDQGFMDAMARGPDLDGDGLPEVLVGGNGRTLRMCSGKDGTVLWNGRLDRPIRDVAVSASARGDKQPDCLAVTAGGLLASLPCTGKGDRKPRWTAAVGDVGRAVISPGDLNGDGISDVVVCAENGVVAAYNGDTGSLLWRWQGPDVVRAICDVGDCDGDGIPDVAAACLDGTVILLSGGSTGQIACLAPSTAPASAKTTSRRVRPARQLSASRPSAGNPAVRILLYHDILPEVFYRYATPVKDFVAQMDALVAEGYQCVSLDEIADWIDGKGGLPPKSVCITFDGPYEGHYTYAMPVLRERGLFAVDYITTDWIGTANHADWRQLREMEASGVFDIENHTLNHPSLTGMPRDAVIEQLRGCNEAIARHLDGKFARHHAYPSGVQNDDVRDIVRSLGFRTAVIVSFRPVTGADDRMRLPRYTLTNTTTIKEFRSWLRSRPAVEGR